MNRMTDLVSVDRNLNDLTPHPNDVGLTGRTEITLLDNLRVVSVELHGRITFSSSTTNNYKIYLNRRYVHNMIVAYQNIMGYGLSSNLTGLISALRSSYNNSSPDQEALLTNSVVTQIFQCNEEISINLSRTWDSVFGIRLASGSGINKDIVIDGKQNIMNKVFKGIPSTYGEDFLKECRKVGQLAGVRTSRQVEARDLLSDLLFSRKGNYASLNEIFSENDKQRQVVKQFRTDILFCSFNRMKELIKGLIINPELKCVVVEETVTVTPIDYTRVTFYVKNKSFADIVVKVKGSRAEGSVTLSALSMTQRNGTAIEINLKDFSNVEIKVEVDIRENNSSSDSLARLALDGKLSVKDSNLSSLYFQICEPIRPYAPMIVSTLKGNELLQNVCSGIGEWVYPVISGLDPGYLFESWLSTQDTPERERIFYVYLLSLVIPEMLLNPTLTFNAETGTPPYFAEYGYFSRKIRALYD